MWINGFAPFVMLAPLVSWSAPANVPESYLLRPSLRYCQRRLDFQPDITLGDMGYIHQETKRHFREEWNMAILTKLKADMKARCDFSEDEPIRCPQGQPLDWLGYDPQGRQHWFGAPAEPALCPACWQQSACDRQFARAASEHETFLGMIPLNTALAKKLLRSVRSWVEPAQAFEKNQLGLKAVFLNSLRLCWTMGLLADSAALLRILAVLAQPKAKPILHELFPTQTILPFE